MAEEAAIRFLLVWHGTDDSIFPGASSAQLPLAANQPIRLQIESINQGAASVTFGKILDSYSWPIIVADSIVVQTDRLFSDHDPGTGEFSFDENVARVFDDMINRSIPLYADVQRSIPMLVQQLDHDPIRIVDLGCSTGTSLIHLARSLPQHNLELIGVDNSQPMLSKCVEKLAALGCADSAKVVCEDIQKFDLNDASVVLMNYTLQFIDPGDRLEMLTKVASGIRAGGFLLLSEKVTHPDAKTNEALIEMYFDYKRRQGYSELEIARKRDALENVLVPLTVEDNLLLLEQAGFGQMEVLLKWFNFTTFVARV